MLLKDWAQHPEIHDEFWSNARSPYRKIVNKALSNFTKWTESHPFPKPPNISLGLLPGDYSSTVSKGDMKLGIVSLNITFLQLTEGNYEGKLSLHTSQLSTICGEHFDDWFKGHDFNLLLTHQPPSWLNPASVRVYDGEIYRPGRFVAHMYGHMHEPKNYAQATGGADAKRFWQGCSLFGLEYYGDKKEETRLHGYTAGSIRLNGDTCHLLLWPRKAALHQAGHQHIVADDSVTLIDGESLPPENIPFSRKPRATTSPKPKSPPFRVLILSTDKDLASARTAIAEHLRRALGVEVAVGSVDSAIDPNEFTLVILLQGWWWDNGGVAQLWERTLITKRVAFVVNEMSEWPPRLLTERDAEQDILQFRGKLSEHPHYFDRPEELPEKVGTLVTALMQSETGNEGVGLKEWERTYLAFRLPAWKSGRTALSPGHLLEADYAGELYQADLYVSLDGTARNWVRGTDDRPSRRSKAERHAPTELRETRVRLGKWLSVLEIPRIALVGAPGGGKTVFLTRAAAAIASACLGRSVDLEPDLDLDCLRHPTGMLPIPVLLEATRIAKQGTLDVTAVIEAMADEFASTGGQRPEREEIWRGLQAGRYILLIDALDEIPSSPRRAKVLDILKGIADLTVFPKTRFVLTTRAARYTGTLIFGPELETVEVAPLNNEQVNQLCGNWCQFRQHDQVYTDSLMAAVTSMSLQIDSSTEDQALTENPLMLTAICMVYERYQSLPDDRGRLCELLIDDLCRSRNSEDLERGWKLDDASKKDLLQRIALSMQERGAQAWAVTYATEIALSMVPASDRFRQERAKKYLDWTADHTGLLRFQQSETGEEQIRFWHRLFREYLAASRLAQLDKTASDMINQLWQEKRLINPFWEDVIRLLPRPLGTMEKARSLRESLESLAQADPSNKGRLLGLSVAAIVENRDLYPDIHYPDKANELAEIYKLEGLDWPLRDRLLFLEGLGRLDNNNFDPRFHGEIWIDIPAGSIKVIESKPSIKVSKFAISWAPVTVQEYKTFIDASDFDNPVFWKQSPSGSRLPKVDSLEDRIRKQIRHPNWPVVSIAPFEAIAFCLWRTAHRSDGKLVRLPTEAEWKQAFIHARKGKYLWGDAPVNKGGNAQIHWSGTDLNNPVPVGTFPVDKLGIADLLGNTFEWAIPSFPGTAADDLESGKRQKANYMVVGGSFTVPKEYLEDPFSDRLFPPVRRGFENFYVVGFRCVLSSKS
jgi:hypothetical protein